MTDITYYYAPVSGYAYLGEPRLVEMALKYNVQVHFKPVDILRVFAESGTTPPPKQPKARLDYRLQDLQRTADYLNLPINPKPRHWPGPVELAARCIYAASQSGVDPHTVSFALLKAVYAQEQDVSDETSVRAILSSLGLNAGEIIESAWSEAIGEAFETATQEAISLGIFGSPTYVLNGQELFFGQDRLHLLEHALLELETKMGSPTKAATDNALP